MADHKPIETRERGYILNHGIRTAKIAMSLLDSIPSSDVQPDILFAAAVFHDIGKGNEPHNESGAAMAEELLYGQCLPDEIAAITQIILDHNQRHRAMECSLAARIQQDADIIDHFGTICVWLGFHWNAVKDESPAESLKYFRGKEHREWTTWARGALNFDQSLKIFDGRLAFQEDFFDRFAMEIDGQI